MPGTLLAHPSSSSTPLCPVCPWHPLLPPPLFCASVPVPAVSPFGLFPHSSIPQGLFSVYVVNSFPFKCLALFHYYIGVFCWKTLCWLIVSHHCVLVYLPRHIFFIAPPPSPARPLALVSTPTTIGVLGRSVRIHFSSAVAIVECNGTHTLRPILLPNAWPSGQPPRLPFGILEFKLHHLHTYPLLIAVLVHISTKEK